MIWPFPLIRNYLTNKHVTAIFIAFANCDDLTVAPDGAYRTTVSCSLGRLEFWTGNPFYAWGDNGCFTNSDGLEQTWIDEMPSRWAVRKMANVISRQRFIFGKKVAV